MHHRRSDSAPAGGRSKSGAAGSAAPDDRGRPAASGANSRSGGTASWWKLFLIWAIVLSIPCWFLADAYHAGLRAATSAILGLELPKRSGGEVEVHATHILGIFAAMCLASLRAPLGRRLRAILIGVPVLMAMELLTGIIAIQTDILDQTGGGLPVWLLEFRDQALAAPPWLGAPLLWLLLVGPWQIRGPQPRGASRKTR